MSDSTEPIVKHQTTMPEVAAGDQPQRHYTLSSELCHLIGVERSDAAERRSADEIVQMLLAAGALTVASTPVALAENAGKNRWQQALRPALAFRKTKGRDSWAKYQIHNRPTELAVRWDYDASRRAWESSETLIKMETTSFARGAMRECFRMKKMSQVSATFFYKMDWEACNNYVAKRYLIEETERETYFSDIEMQMLSKRDARQYNGLAPPKKVDFLHAFVVEVNRGGQQMLFCVERAIEAGHYLKHNNNSGFVEVGADESGDAYRATPNAFSRFTFHASAGERMIIDIQGVDDVYTDPQIHTVGGAEYGDGNLGVGGMALFFSTSQYDPLCRCLALPDFHLSDAERKRVHGNITANQNLSGSDARTALCKNPSALVQTAHKKMLQRRASLKSNAIGENELLLTALPLHLLREDAEGEQARQAGGLPPAGALGASPPSSGEGGEGGKGGGPAPIGLVHAKLAEFNLSGALPLLKDSPDVASAGYHLVCACAANEVKALRDMRALARGMSGDELLPGVRLTAGSQLDQLGEWLVPVLTARLAASGDATAMLETANDIAAAGEDGATNRAAAWVQAAIDAVGRAPAALRTELQLGGCAAHQLYERLAELQLKDGDEAAAGSSYESAAEAAMEAGKPKQSMKLQALAEQYASGA